MSDPLKQFLVLPLIPIEIFGFDLSLTNSAVFMLLAALIPPVFLYAASDPNRLTPGLFQSLAESLYIYVADMLDETNGVRGQPYLPLVFSLFVFVLMGNLLGMLPFAFTFTSQLIVTFSLATFVFLMVILIGIFKHKGRFFTLFFPSGVPLSLAPLLIPIELLSFFSRPISLSVRLFANMMAGHTMLKVFAGFVFYLGLWGLAPVALNVVLIAFEILVAVLQAYVFTVLTCLYLHDVLYLHHHHDSMGS